MGILSRRDRGFTLVELMVVVAIVGVLSAVAVFAYTKWVKKARLSEVHEMFGHFALKQEQYYVENGKYRATAGSESNAYPSPTKSRPSSATSGRPGSWDDLRVDIGKNELYCSYVLIAGPGGDGSAIGALGSEFMPDEPSQDWWYGIARCPFAGKRFGFRWDRDKPFPL